MLTMPSFLGVVAPVVPDCCSIERLDPRVELKLVTVVDCPGTLE